MNSTLPLLLKLASNLSEGEQKRLEVYYQELASCYQNFVQTMPNSEHPFALELTERGLGLVWQEQPHYAPLVLDFLSGKQAFRRQQGGGKQEAVVRALGIAHGHRPRIVDATAGLGRDAVMLAQTGSPVYLLERQCPVHAILSDALYRAQQAAQQTPSADLNWLQHTHLLPLGSLLDASTYSLIKTGIQAEAIYLDPMFPERKKSAAVKKDMQMLQAFIGGDDDADLLFERAMELASHRVVVKRPVQAPFLAGISPSSQIITKAHRFDLYIKQGYTSS